MKIKRHIIKIKKKNKKKLPEVFKAVFFIMDCRQIYFFCSDGFRFASAMASAIFDRAFSMSFIM